MRFYLTTRTRKIWRDILAYPARSAMVAVSIFVGVLGVVILTTMGQLVSEQLQSDLQQDELAMLRVYLTPPETASVDNVDVLERLRAHPGVAVVEGQAVYEQRWRRPDENTFHDGELFAYSEDFGQIQIEPMYLVEGRYPTRGQNELVIDQRMAEAQDLSVGDTLILPSSGIFGERFVPVVAQEWRIVGIVFQPYIYFGSSGAQVSMYAHYEDARRLIGFKGYSSLYARFTSFTAALENSDEFRAYINQQTPYTIVFHLLDNPTENSFIVGVRRFRDFMLALSIIAIVVSGFLVSNIISNVVTEQRRHIGSMKAIGATQRDIILIYCGMALTYGLMGALPALIMGVVVGDAAAHRVAPLANTRLEGFQISPLAVVLGLGLGLLMPLLASILPVRYATQITILEAMTDLGLQTRFGRKSVIPQMVKRLPVSMTVRQSLNDVLRKRGRLALSILALTLAVAAFMGVFALFVSLTRVINDIRADLNVQLAVQAEPLISTFQTLVARQSEGIRSIAPGVAVELEVVQDEEIRAEDEDIPEDDSETLDQPLTLPIIPLPLDLNDTQDPLFVTGIDTENAFLDEYLQEGTAWQGQPNRVGVVITPEIASAFGKGLGDTLRLSTGTHLGEFEIIGIADYPLRTAFMEWNQLSEFVGELLDAPTPNNYWAQIYLEDGTESEDEPVWAIGVDEQFGSALSEGFNRDEPGILVTDALAEARGYQTGEEVTVRGTGQETAYPVMDVVPLGTQQLRVVAQDVPEALLNEPQPQVVAIFWEDLAELEGLDFATLAPATLYIDLANPPESLATPTITPVFDNQVAFADRVAQTILSVGLVLNIASLLMAVVGGMGLFTILSMSVRERQREIGVMRSVGATNRTIVTLFVVEGVLVGLVAWVIALPLSYLLSAFLLALVPFSEVVRFNYPLITPLIGLIQVILISLIASVWPSLLAARRTVSEILRYS